MNRRRFVLGAAAAASPLAAREQTATLSIQAGRPGRRIPVRYTGLSYESSQLAEPEFFSRGIAGWLLCFGGRRFGGVLRLGRQFERLSRGGSEPGAVAPPLKRAPRSRSKRTGCRTAGCHRRQRSTTWPAFLDETGWELIYGLNLGSGTPERHRRGSRLCGQSDGSRGSSTSPDRNEPDLYHGPTTASVPWLGFFGRLPGRVDEVRRRPSARGSRAPGWPARTWRATPTGSRGSAGRRPNSSPLTVTITPWAAGRSAGETSSGLPRAGPGPLVSRAPCRRISGQTQLPFRMAEGNSCYRGGEAGMSDAFRVGAVVLPTDMLMTPSRLCGSERVHGGGTPRFGGAGPAPPRRGSRGRSPARPARAASTRPLPALEEGFSAASDILRHGARQPVRRRGAGRHGLRS